MWASIAVQTTAARVAAVLTRAIVGAKLYPLSGQESTNGLTAADVDVSYDYGDIYRYKAVGDGATDDAAAFANAVKSGYEIRLGAAVYYLSSLTLSGEIGLVMRGQGQSRTRLLLDAPAAFAVTVDNCQYCLLEGFELRAATVDTAIMQVSQSGTGNSLNNVLRDVLFNGNNNLGQPAKTDTNSIGLYAKGGAAGYGNYFNLLDNVAFQGLQTCIKTEYNANAWKLSNIHFEQLWYGITGGAQEWIGVNFWWHRSQGDATQNAILIDMDGDATNGCQYNKFLNIMAEPGTTDTQLVNFGPYTDANFVLGDDQCPTPPADAGTNNSILAPGIRRTWTGGALALALKGLTVGDLSSDIDGEYDFNLFGDGTNAQPGTGQQKLRIFGANGTTRALELFMTAGDAILNAIVAGGLEFQQAGAQTVKFDQSTLAAAQTAAWVAYHNGASVVFDQITLGAPDTGGAGFRMLVVPN